MINRKLGKYSPVHLRIGRSFGHRSLPLVTLMATDNPGKKTWTQTYLNDNIKPLCWQDRQSWIVNVCDSLQWRRRSIQRLYSLYIYVIIQSVLDSPVIRQRHHLLLPACLPACLPSRHCRRHCRCRAVADRTRCCMARLLQLLALYDEWASWLSRALC